MGDVGFPTMRRKVDNYDWNIFSTTVHFEIRWGRHPNSRVYPSDGSLKGELPTLSHLAVLPGCPFKKILSFIKWHQKRLNVCVIYFFVPKLIYLIFNNNI